MKLTITSTKMENFPEYSGICQYKIKYLSKIVVKRYRIKQKVIIK